MALLTEEQQNVAVRALATTLGKDVSEIETMLAGEKPTEVDQMVSERIKGIRSEADKAGRAIMQRAAKKKAKELFGVEAEAETIEDLLGSVKETYKPEFKPDQLTEEQVKMHPSFRTMEKTLKDQQSEHEKALDLARSEGQAAAETERLIAKAQKARLDYGAVIPKDAKIAAAMERIYLEGLQGITTKLVDGKVEFWKDGKRVENDKLFPLSEEDFFKSLVQGAYTTKVSDQKDGTGLPLTGGQGGQQGGQAGFTKFKGEAPKTLEEYNKILDDRETYDFAARQEVKAYWEQQQK
ncbi:hypothetical protein [Spirosoma utsteinense]|uniref:hypothetical protein n=1 Tax=Spirosoma utsteinense TaxID=2585773 RepID=UPI001646BD46|nr:hypothetical protein [Spirosoma utsteinense]MBC3785728.1 hypothetical protein [Spirosoma utsteinense]